MDLKAILDDLRSKIKALADKEDIGDEEAQELEDLMSKAEKVQKQIKAAAFATADDGEGDPDGNDDSSDENVSVLATEVAAKLAAMPGFEKGAPYVNLVAHRGDPDPDMDFLNYIRTGKGKIKAHTEIREVKIGPNITVKAALQEGTTTEGGYLVPVGELGRIIEKRSETSLLDKLGVMPFSTDRDTFNIPTEDSAMTRFTIVAEEGAISGAQNEPTFGQLAVTLYKFGKLIKASTEILSDENSGLEAYLSRAIGRAWAATDNYYAQLGSGSSQPQGVFVGGTAALTLDAAAAIGAAEVPELIGKLKVPYRSGSPGAVVVMNRTTAAYLAGLTGDQFQFRQPPASILNAGGEDLGIGYPVFATEDCAAIGAGNKSLLFGNFEYFGWVRNRSLEVVRLNELYRTNGQIGIWAEFRAGGGVLQAEAFNYATHPTA